MGKPGKLLFVVVVDVKKGTPPTPDINPSIPPTSLNNQPQTQRTQYPSPNHMLPSHALHSPLARHNDIHHRRRKTAQQHRAQGFRSPLPVECEHGQSDGEVPSAEDGHERERWAFCGLEVEAMVAGGGERRDKGGDAHGGAGEGEQESCVREPGVEHFWCIYVWIQRPDTHDE